MLCINKKFIFHFLKFIRKGFFGKKRLKEKYNNNLKFVGKGSFGIVFAVMKDGKSHALKVVQCDNATKANQALKEIMNLNHLVALDNILTFKDSVISNFAIEKNVYFHIEILMELADYTLKEEIQSSVDKRIAEDKLLNYLKQITNGLLNASKRKFAHLDLKPANVLIFNNVAKIGDWGGSVFLKPNPSGGSISLIGSQDAIAFTRAFASPELLQLYDDENNAKLEQSINYHLCDIYSCGIMILNCCGISLKEINGIHKFQISSKGHDKEIKALIDNIKGYGYSKKILNLVEKMCKYIPKERLTIEKLSTKLNK